MSLLSYKIRCDWPGCPANEDIPYYASACRDYRWVQRDGPDSAHLCPTHRFKTWRELDLAVGGPDELEHLREQVKELEEQLREAVRT